MVGIAKSSQLLHRQKVGDPQMSFVKQCSQRVTNADRDLPNYNRKEEQVVATVISCFPIPTNYSMIPGNCF